MKIAFWGTSEFVGAVRNARFLRGLVAAGIKPALVVTAPDTSGASGERGKELAPGAVNPVRTGALRRADGSIVLPSAIPTLDRRQGQRRSNGVKAAALEFGIPLLQPQTLEGFSKELAGREIELSLVAAYGKILPPDVLAVPKFGSLNIHPSLLPRWRGPTPIQTAILAGDSVTGVAVIKMDEQMDHGPIIAKREFPLGGRDWTAPELSDALTDLGVELFLEILEPWALGRIVPQPQNHEAATYSRMLKKEEGHIDWSKSAEEIERMARAFKPWPGAYSFWQRGSNQVRLSMEAVEVGYGQGEGRSDLGKVLDYNGRIAVAAAKDFLIIKEIKPEGGRTMSAREFLNGHADVVGAVLI